MKKNIIWLSLLLICLTGCSGDDLSQDSVVDAHMGTLERTELDLWIMDNYTLPYGIDVVYHWDRNATQEGTFAYPPSIEKVKPVLETLKTLWLELYTEIEVGGESFFKGKNPLRIYLYGGRSLDMNGVEMVCNAHSSNSEIYIYNVNEFDPADKDKLFVLMRSVHHQYAKKLAEIYPYKSDEFYRYSSGSYTRTTDFFNRVEQPKTGKSLFEIRKYSTDRGFCSLHAMILPEEDFAEMSSIMLLHTPSELNKKFTHASLKGKKEFIEKYYEQNVKIPFRILQVNCIRKMNSFHQKMNQK